MITKIKKMFRKNWLLLSLMIAALMAVTVYRGGVYMTVKAEEQHVKKLKAERASVCQMKNTFSGITEIKITRCNYHPMTGFYGMYAIVQSEEYGAVDFAYSYVENEKTLSDYTVKNRDIQRKGITQKKVRVTYSNGEKEEV
ncbi:hypothetical protein LQZ24_04440 [Fructobacillus sp. M1-13]|uniref:Uncharacterized protein n=1 Tax=Fructobacillus papyriferae TaxID=2713171 RepID=A0ABS5QQN5_9LACO|nr:hypothetical protein [Fructobacillus papyriferae]MBS9335503.1 hypothetical protein [Fructobacillus papyriferae]MCD2159273.1 hypothetical protein [Fructobacillus papyriferae]